MNPILQKVLKKVSPKEDLLVKVKAIVDEITHLAKKYSATVKVGGSLAKGTYLEGDCDCDIFVLFDKNQHPAEQLSDLLGEILSPFAPTRVHGSRDYFQFTKKGMFFEVIPVYAIREPKEAKNITDCSPLHVQWVLKSGLQNEIRLVKAFCKAAGVYGAESYIGGFSGHVIDILTIYYGSFEKFLEASLQWKNEEIIDVTNYYKGKKPKLNESKKSPLIVIDPIDPERNAAAALTSKKIKKLQTYAKEYLENPTEEKFYKKPFMLSSLILSHPSIIIELTPLEGKRDVVGAKLLKSIEYIATQLTLRHFSLKSWDWHWKEGTKATAWYSFENPPIPDEIILEGPPIKSMEHCKAFRQKHKEVFEKNKRLFARETPMQKNPKKVIAQLLGEAYITEKIAAAKMLEMKKH